MIGLTYPSNNKRKVVSEYLSIGTLETKVITHKKGIAGLYAYIDATYTEGVVYESLWTEFSGLNKMTGFLSSAVYDSQLGQLTIKARTYTSSQYTSHVIVFYYE